MFREQVKSSSSNTSKLPKPAQPKLNVVKPFTSGRTLGLKKSDSTVVTRSKEVTVAVVAPLPAVDSVQDIDKGDLGMPFLVPEYANEIYSYLRHLEVSVLVKEFPTKQNTYIEVSVYRTEVLRLDIRLYLPTLMFPFRLPCSMKLEVALLHTSYSYS